MSDPLAQLGAHLQSATTLVREIELEMRRLRRAEKAEASKRFVSAAAEGGSESLRLLGLDDSASKEQIRAAYRRMAAVWHPDRPDGNRQVFERISIAAASLLER